MLKIFLWFRYLQKRRIVFLSIAAVAVSVSLLIVVASLFTGFIATFESSAVEALGDVVLDATPLRFGKYQVLIQKLEELPVVEAATATLTADGLLHVGKGNVRAVKVWGIEPGSRSRVTGLRQYLLRQKNLPTEPSFDVPSSPGQIGGFVGIAVLTDPNEKTDEYDLPAVRAQMGQQVVVTTGTVAKPDPSDGPSRAPAFKRRVIPFRIADVVFTGVYDLDRRFIYLPIDRLHQALYPDEPVPSADSVQIKLRRGADPESAVAQVRGLWRIFAENDLGWSDYRVYQADVVTSRQMQSRYVGEIRKQMGMLLLIFGVVSFSVIVLIFCIFYMIVRLKQKDIAVIKSCGSSNQTVVSIFIGFGLCIGVIGSILGTIMGDIITRNINSIEHGISVVFGLKLWESSVYMFSKIPNQVDWGSAGSIVVLAVIASAVGALVPAVVAARTRPVEVLRYE